VCSLVSNCSACCGCMSEFLNCSLSRAYRLNMVDLRLSGSLDHKHTGISLAVSPGCGAGGLQTSPHPCSEFMGVTQKSRDPDPVPKVCLCKRNVSFRVSSFCSMLTSGHLLKTKFTAVEDFSPCERLRKASNCFTACWFLGLCPTRLFI